MQAADDALLRKSVAKRETRWYGISSTVRLGVSSKIFVAYGVLVLAFAASSILSLVSLHRGREEMAVDLRRRELQAKVEMAERNLQQFSEALVPGAPGLTSRVGAQGGLAFARDHLEQARGVVAQFLAEPTGNLAARQEFEDYGDQLAELAAKVDSTVRGTGPAVDDASPEKKMPSLIAAFTRLKQRLRSQGEHASEQRVRDEERARNMAVMLGAAGLLAAVGAVLFMLRTLRPLKVLRIHARAIAGGEYGRRIVVPSRDEIGELAREFDAMGRAVEEREQRLIRSERLATVGRMAAQITHEVRNPLASLGLYTELLADELRPEDEEAHRLVAAIGKELDRLSDITETYLRFVRLPTPKLEREDLGAIAVGVMEFARAELSMSRISLELAIAPGLPEVAADENQIRQALLNLARNAREAMPGGGKLRVEVGTAPSGQVRLSIADTGPGIAPEHLNKIFDPFFSTKDRGTGLGLSLVQQIVAVHGGRIEVTSLPEGGTVFVLTFPALPPESRISVREAEPTTPEPASPEEVLETAPAFSKMN